MTTRGIRNRNPGNIVWTGTPLFPGEIGPESEGTFAQFDTVENGIRAIALNLTAYQDRHGLNTIDGIIRRWSATDQDAYIANVSAALGIAPDQTLDVHSPSVMVPLVAAIIRQENGEQPFDVSAILGFSPATVPEPPTAPATPLPATLPSPQPTGGPMGGIGLILGLLQTLLPVFSPGAQAKIGPILGGLTGQSAPVPTAPASSDDKQAAIFAFATQMMQAVLQASGHANPAAATDADKVAATAAVMQSPALIQKVEQDTVAQLNALGSSFDRLAKIEADKQAGDDASHDLALARAAAGAQANLWDMAPALVWWALGAASLIVISLMTLAGIYAWNKQALPEMLLTLVVQTVTGILGFVALLFAFRFGTSRSSGAKDELVAQLAMTRKQ